MVGSEMPKGWDKVKLLDIADLSTGKVDANHSTEDGLYPFFTCASEPMKSPDYSFDDESVIVPGNGANVGCVLYYNGKFQAYQRTYVLSNIKIVPKYLYYHFLRYWKERTENNQFGSATNYVKLINFANYIVDMPSLTEQKQIAEKLDKLFDQIETIKEASNKIPELLKNFRQQVLTYAVTGKLTNSDFAHWEKSTIGTIGKVKGGKRLPKGEELVNYNTGYPYIRARDLKEGTVLKQNIMYLLPETQEKIKNYIVKTDDVYITIVGAKIGDAGIIPESMNNANLTENAAKITDLSEKIMPQYLSLWLQAPLCQSEIQQSIKSAAQGKLALTRINSLSVCFPPIESQKEIIDKVEYLLGELKIIESKFYLLQDILDKLPQALLCKAFKGELL